MRRQLLQRGVEIGAAITDGYKAIHGKPLNEFIALIDRQPPVGVSSRSVGELKPSWMRFVVTWNRLVTLLRIWSHHRPDSRMPRQNRVSWIFNSQRKMSKQV